MKGVCGAFYPSDDLLDTICTEERGIIASGGLPTLNEGVFEAVSREFTLAAAVSDELDLKVDEPTIVLRSRSGRVIGMNVTEDMRGRYADDPDVIWISDDFILLTDSPRDGGGTFVMPPVRFPLLNDSHGCRNVVCGFPATTTGHRLME